MSEDATLRQDPWYEKPCIKRMVEESNGHTIFSDRQDPNAARDPYAPSRDFTYYMKLVLPGIWDDMVKEELSPSIVEVAKKLGVENLRLREGFNSLVDTINGFVGSGRSHIGQTLDEVAEEFGYKQLEPETKTVLEAIIGRYFIASFFFAAKCLTPTGGTPVGNIGYKGTFDFISNEVKQALDGVETKYARKLKDEKEGDRLSQTRKKGKNQRSRRRTGISKDSK